MATPIRIEKFDDQQRQVRGRGRTPVRNQSSHGAYLKRQLKKAVEDFHQRTSSRQSTLPNLPDGIQVVIKGATTQSGSSLLDSAKLRGLKLEVLEERSEGLLIALSPDPELKRFSEAVEDFRTDAHSEPTPNYPEGRRKRGVNTVFTVDDVQPTPRDLRMGDELSEIVIKPRTLYIVDIEIAAGSELEDEGVERRREFSQYLREANALIFGSGPIVEDDYALYRAEVNGQLLEDLLDVHIWVLYVELPPHVEMEGLKLRRLRGPNIPPFNEPEDGSACICIIDSGVVTEHPLLVSSMNGNPHRSFIPEDESIGDSGPDGHGTGVASIASLGSLRTALNGGQPIQPVPVVLARILDNDTRLPASVNLKVVLPTIVQVMRETAEACIYNHSIASRAQFNPNRMSIWAETIDRIIYDDGGDGCLFIVCTGNVDGFRPAFNQITRNLIEKGHPNYLLDDSYRLRNPAQAINALTVGAYVPNSVASFVRRSAGRSPVAAEN